MSDKLDHRESLPEVTPELVSEDIEVVLSVTASDIDGHAFVMAHTDGMAGNTAEQQARQMLSGNGSGKSNDYQRCAALVRVRIPRSLLRERWAR